MEAYTTDAGILRLVAIDAIKKRAIAAGVGQADSTDAQKAAYVPVWIWNHVTERLKALPGRSKGVGTSIAVSQRADLWASGVNRRYLHPPSSGSTVWMSPPVQKAAPCGVDTVGVDEPGKGACYSGGTKGRDDNRGKERLRSLSHHDATNDSVRF